MKRSTVATMNEGSVRRWKSEKLVRGKRALALFLSRREEKERDDEHDVIDALVGKLKEGSTHECLQMEMQVKMTTRRKLGSSWRSINGRRINAEYYLNNKM